MINEGITGIILAGGASRRMGKDKGLCLYNGKELISYSIEILKPICDSIIISSNSPEDYLKFGLQIVEDEIKSIGPIGGIYSCLNQSANTHNLVLSCDTPYIQKESMAYILSNSKGFDIVIPQHRNSYFEPLAGYYSSRIVPQIENSIQNKDYKLINLFAKVKFRSISTEVIPGLSLQYKNLNTPEDLNNG